MSIPKFYLYARKSTEDEDHQIMSIEAQLCELREFAQKEGLEIVEEITEAKSAKIPGREKFGEMIAKIEKADGVGILAWHPDRLARNSIDGGRIIYLVDIGKIVALHFPTFWFEPTPQGKFMLSVAFGQAKYYTDNLRENILRGIRQKIRRGELSAKAPLGYFNEPKLRTIEPNIKTFKKVKECLEAFATGKYTLTAMQKKMFSIGLTSHSENLLHIASVRHILENPFYYGYFRYRGEIHQGSHKPMISKKLFDQIQQALADNGKPRKKRGNKGFYFLNFAACGDCGYSITAERKTKKSGKIYIYYRCTHKSKMKICGQHRFLREEKLAEQVKDCVQKVSLPDEWREKYLERLNQWETEGRQPSELFAQNLQNQLLALKAKINRLTDAYLDGGLELSEYQERKNKLMTERKDFEEKLSDFERKGNRWLELARKWILEANQAEKLAQGNDFQEMRAFLEKIGSNRRIQNQTLAVELKMPWISLEKLAKQNPAEGGAGENLPPETEMWTWRESNSRLYNANVACYHCTTGPCTKSYAGILYTEERKNFQKNFVRSPVLPGVIKLETFIQSIKKPSI